MNTAALGATLAAHKVPLLVGGAGVAVVLGLRARKASASSSTTGAPIAGYAASSGTTNGYDSSATDVYNALQPQIEQTQGMLGQLQTWLSNGSVPTPVAKAPTPVPVAPGPKTTPAPVVHAPAPAPRRLPPPSPVRLSPTAPRVYTVRSGDSLSAIAARFGLAGGWNQLYTANKAAVGRNPNLIHPGLQLTIPGR